MTTKEIQKLQTSNVYPENQVNQVYKCVKVKNKNLMFRNPITFPFMLIVCFDIKLNIVGEASGEKDIFLKKNATMRWKLGACTSLNSIDSGTTYHHPAIYTERCCLKPGKHTLVCYNNPPARGWNNANILINGHRYCDDFDGYKSFLKILVSGIDFIFYSTWVIHAAY